MRRRDCFLEDQRESGRQTVGTRWQNSKGKKLSAEKGRSDISFAATPAPSAHSLTSFNRHSSFPSAPIGFLLCLFFLGYAASAQSLKPQGYFSADTVKVGEPVRYTLTFRYPRDLEVVFPGEGAAYSPFEYLDRTFFPTRSDSLYSYDSVVYEVATFELDSVQPLTLPVYVVDADEEGNADSTAIYADIDSVYLRAIIQQLPDSVALKENTNPLKIPLQFNYPYLLVGIGAFVALLILGYLLFGKQIRRRWQLRRLRRANRQFTARFGEAIAALKTHPDQKHSEEALVLWKRYMERLDRTPYTKMTTREIAQLPSGEPLRDDLRAIDRSIYGKAMNGELIGHFEQLQQHTNVRFQQRIDEIKHG